MTESFGGRPGLRVRPLVSAGQLHDAIGSYDETERGWPPATTTEQRQIRAFIIAGLCPWCDGSKTHPGPFASIAGHTTIAHGVDRFQLRELAGLYRNSVICSDEHHLRTQQNLRRRIDAGEWVPTHPHGGPHTFSTAGRATQAAKTIHMTHEERVRAGYASAAARTPEQQRAMVEKSARTVRRKAAARAVQHGTSTIAARHRCRCDLCLAYRRWVKRRGPKPTPGDPVTRPCYPGCAACVALLSVGGELDA